MKCVQILAFAALSLGAASVAAQTKVAKAAPAGSRAQVESVTTPAAAAEATQAQLRIASQVLVGRSDCEFKQHVNVAPLDGRPGHFRVSFKNASYTMVPQETSTGAVRLEDRQAGVIWLQIASKSMLMNSKAGQRMADACLHADQRAVATAVKNAKPSLLVNR